MDLLCCCYPPVHLFFSPVRLFQTVHLLFFANLPDRTFIPDCTFIPYLRVLGTLKNRYEEKSNLSLNSCSYIHTMHDRQVIISFRTSQLVYVKKRCCKSYALSFDCCLEVGICSRVKNIVEFRSFV